MTPKFRFPGPFAIYVLPVFIFFVGRIAPAASAGIEVLNQARVMIQNHQLDAAEKLLQKALESKPNKNLELLYFQTGYIQLKLDKLDQAQENFLNAVANADNLKEYSYFFLGQIAEKKKDGPGAEKYYRDIDKLSPNFSLRIESQKNLASLLLAKKDFRGVRQVIAPLERRSRGTETYPDMIYILAQAEMNLKNNSGACKWLRKLYARSPNFDKIKDWGEDLSADQFMGEATQCSSNLTDFRERVRNLLWLGNDQKALIEIEHVRGRAKDQEPYMADSILAQYYLQEGEVQKASDILKSHFKTMKNNFDYLLLFATAAARAGDNTAAVGAYYQAYRLAPHSASGKRALYQSAFLSYQFQDYDGAYRKFQEFIRKFSHSGLTQDAEWHLAWLKYLKNDYEGAARSFSGLEKSGRSRRRQSAQSDRNHYWLAMSLLKQGKIISAKNIFEKLSQDKLMGYYSMAAQARLKQIGSQPVETRSKLLAREQAMRIDRFSMSEFMMPSDDLGTSSASSETDESEENVQLVALNAETSKNVKDDSEESESVDNPEAPEVKPGPEGAPAVAAGESDESHVTDFKNPLLAQRFQKARDLQILGLDDWAKWDLFEIERKTRNKEYLKTLMAEYSALKNFHRSSYIAQTYFSRARQSYGVEGIKFIWQEAFPQAFADDVQAQAKKFDVPQGLIWGIMRAESHYRQDAISPVGALGLMQIMPSTAHRMAEKIGLKDFKSSQLLTPGIAIQVGAGYLQRLMKKFNRNSALVAAAYNAGPHRVYSWLNSFGQLQLDEFIEHIPFLETRNYVKRVVTNQQTYSQVYNLNQSLTPMLSESIQVTIPDRIPAKESWEDI